MIKTMTKIFILAFLALLLIPITARAQTAFTVPPEMGGRWASNIRSAPTYVQARVLAAGASETITLPAGTKFVIFSATCNFYAKNGASAAVPAADVTDGTASELNPAAWYFTNASTQVTVIADTASCVVTASAYTGP